MAVTLKGELGLYHDMTNGIERLKAGWRLLSENFKIVKVISKAETVYYHGLEQGTT